MKKLFLFVAMCCIVSVTALAQENKWAVGLNVGYGTDISKFFLGAKVQYDITDAFTAAASFNHFFKDSYDIGMGEKFTAKWWDINVDVHWNFIHTETLKVYPLVGITYLNVKSSYEGQSSTDGKFGANIGIGGQYNISSNWAVGIEAKYQIIEGGQFVPMATIMYRF